MTRERIIAILRYIVMAAMGGLWIYGFGYIIFLLGVSFVQPHMPVEKTDAIIVLTGGQNRINTGLDLLAAGKADHLFISGVHPDVTIEYLVRQWKPDIVDMPCCIALGYAASNTEGNAKESSQWVRDMGLHSVRLVTSNYHLPRAWVEFSYALPRRKIYPHPIRPVSMTDGSRQHLRLSFSEYNKTILTWVRLYVYPWDTVVKISQW